MPATQFQDPWANSLFQDTQPFAMGIYEGLATRVTDEVRALRTAELELADDPDAAAAVPTTLSWRDFSDAERELMPTILTISGDGAAYDIGFGAMSRVMAMGTPIKVLVLDTGGYSNTGGQASTASFTGQDADLARFGRAHGGKRETRKELGLLAAFHPHVFSCATSPSLHAHYLDAAMRMIDFESGMAVMITYTPCDTENGFAEDLSNKRSRLAVEARMTPLFIHDPSAGTTLPQRFNLDGNPDIDKLWSTSTIQYVDDEGNAQLMTTPLTPAEFALGEVRFSKQFHPMAPDADGVEIAEYVELPMEARADKTPFVWATDADRKLIKVAVASPVVALVEDRKHYWQTLQFLAGVGAAPAGDPALQAEFDDLKVKYEAALADREASMDAIAESMVKLVTAKDPSTVQVAIPGLGVSSAPAAAASASAAAPAASAPVAASASGGVAKPAIWIDPADQPKCTDCGTCYQDLPAYFEKTTILVDGQPRPVARFKEGSLDGVEITAELRKKMDKVRDTCDSEIIQ
jgi:pyruvate-ferredoxin/flavodoxin oxidoreductase